MTAEVIYLFDPTNPSSVKTFPVPQQTGFVVNASGLAISNSSDIYYGVLALAGIGAQHRRRTGSYLRAVITSDNSRVFFNQASGVRYVDAATDTLVWAPDNVSRATTTK